MFADVGGTTKLGRALQTTTYGRRLNDDSFHRLLWAAADETTPTPTTIFLRIRRAASIHPSNRPLKSAWVSGWVYYCGGPTVGRGIL